MTYAFFLFAVSAVSFTFGAIYGRKAEAAAIAEAKKYEAAATAEVTKIETEAKAEIHKL